MGPVGTWVMGASDIPILGKALQVGLVLEAVHIKRAVGQRDIGVT
jgi:hypothetical protein